MDEYRITQPLLKTMALTLIVTGAIGSATGIVLGRWGIAIPPLLVIALGLFAYRLTMRGHTRLVAILVTCVLCFLTVLQAMTAAGPLSATWMSIPVAVMFAAWTLGARASVIVFVFGVIAMGVVYAMKLSGYPFPEPVPFAFVVNLFAIGAMAMVIGITASNGVAQKFSKVKELSDQLLEANQSLEQRVIERTRDLAEANSDLADANLRMENTLETLRHTQAELVQREKLASLGRMVAGLAHELNTPLGNALTIGSTLHSQMRQLKSDVEAGQLKKSTLQDYLVLSTEGAEVLERSLQKAHSLFANFRQAAQDHTDEPLSQFDLSELLSSMRMAMQPAFEGTPISLEFVLAERVEMKSYPGHISQILSQLINNARAHAFTDGHSGGILVTLALEGERVQITVADNGHGIADDIRDKVFDPFFTARMGGSVGLGLSTVFSVITSKLGGSIQLEENQPHGAVFVVQLARNLSK